MLQDLRNALICKYLAGLKSGCSEYSETKADYLDKAPKGWNDYRLKYLFSEINVRSEKGLETHLSKLTKALNDEIDYIKEFQMREVSDVVTGRVDIRNIAIPKKEIALDRFDSSLMDFDDIDDETVDEEVDE